MFLRLLNLHLSPPTLQGGDTATVLKAGLPNIVGSTYSIISVEPSASGALDGTDVLPNGYGITADVNMESKLRYIRFNASNSNAIYGASTTVRPPALQLIPQIKY